MIIKTQVNGETGETDVQDYNKGYCVGFPTVGQSSTAVNSWVSLIATLICVLSWTGAWSPGSNTLQFPSSLQKVQITSLVYYRTKLCAISLKNKHLEVREQQAGPDQILTQPVPLYIDKRRSIATQRSFCKKLQGILKSGYPDFFCGGCYNITVLSLVLIISLGDLQKSRHLWNGISN